jgi:acyl carrier protein
MHEDGVRAVLQAQANLAGDISALARDSDLYDAGLTSLTTVNVMLALEDRFDVEFEDRMLARKTFQSIASLCEAIDDLLAKKA